MTKWTRRPDGCACGAAAGAIMADDKSSRRHAGFVIDPPPPLLSTPRGVTNFQPLRAAAVGGGTRTHSQGTQFAWEGVEGTRAPRITYADRRPSRCARIRFFGRSAILPGTRIRAIIYRARDKRERIIHYWPANNGVLFIIIRYMSYERGCIVVKRVPVFCVPVPVVAGYLYI